MSRLQADEKTIQLFDEHAKIMLALMLLNSMAHWCSSAESQPCLCFKDMPCLIAHLRHNGILFDKIGAVTDMHGTINEEPEHAAASISRQRLWCLRDQVRMSKLRGT